MHTRVTLDPHDMKQLEAGNSVWVPHQNGFGPKIEIVSDPACSAEELTKDERDELRDRWAMASELIHGTPLVVGEFCYTYVRETVKINRCNVFDTLENAEVTIETTGMDVYMVEFRELEWHTTPRAMSALSKVPLMAIIRNGYPDKVESE